MKIVPIFATEQQKTKDMENALTYANLVHALVSKLANMQDAGIIDDFNCNCYINTWGKATYGDTIGINVNFPFDKGKEICHLHLDIDSKISEDWEKDVEKFQDNLDYLVMKKYNELHEANVQYEKIANVFGKIIDNQ